VRNTGTEYTSFERKAVVLPEMAELLPPLSAEQLSALETDMLQNGCYSPIIVNEDMVIIDGHNRQKVCEKYNLPYKMTVFSFEDMLEAKQWALDTQKGRRNLDKWELGKIALKLKADLEARAKEKMSLGGQAYRPSSDNKPPENNAQTEENNESENDQISEENESSGESKPSKKKATSEGKAQKQDKPSKESSKTEKPNSSSEDKPSEEGLATLPNLPPLNTRKEMADSVGIGERTMGKVMQIDEHAPQAVKDALDKKELSINQGYNITKQVQDLPEDEKEKAAVEAIEYEKAKKELHEKDGETERRSKIARTFCKAYEKAVMLTPTEENVRIWTECTRMTLDELDDKIKESRKLAEMFTAIADIIEQKILPSDWRKKDGEDGKEPADNPC